MSRWSSWREFEPGDGVAAVALFCGLLFLCWAAVLDLTWPEQLVVAALTVLAAVWLDRSSASYLVTLTLMLLSVFSTFRYAFWRVAHVVHYLRDPGSRWTDLDAFFIAMLLLAESYAFAVLFLGYLQMLRPLGRTPVPLPDDVEEWPAVDLLIPTLNEPLSMVRFTALAAMNIDWPAEKLNVYILDDGKRDEFRAFAEQAGVGYMTRDDNRHAKAGNINAALARLDSPFIAVFDCDHVPTRSFLQITLGWFLRDRNLGLLQTPQHFYSPDPFERNLDQFRVIPNEGELFYGVVQDGNDFWNAALFCGSCAVLRRAALEKIGGIAVETVSEDAHTSLRMQANGWNSAYINIPQAAGLATERLSGHIRQRIRWARGMVQILRIENPLFATGLTLAQRLCYFNAMLHFLYALPRLIFLTAPLIYLVFSRINIPGFWAAILAVAIPHLVLSNMTNSRVQGQHRYSFWNEIYETVLAPYILLPALLALVSPKIGAFDVTAKGGVVDREFFDARIARPFVLLMGFNVFGLLCAIPRLLQFPTFDVPAILDAIVNWPARIYDGAHPGTIWMNAAWTIFNIVILGVAVAVAYEAQQRRHAVRVAMAIPSDVILADGAAIQGVTSDLSSGGVRARLAHSVRAEAGDPVRFVFPVLDGTATLPATVLALEGTTLRARFDPLNLEEEEALAMILYSRADTWLGWREAREADHPLRSMGHIFLLSLRGLAQTLRGSSGGRRSVAAHVIPMLLLAMLAASPGHARGDQAARSASGSSDVFTLADLGVPGTIVLRGADASRSIFFPLRRNQLVQSATMRLNYHFSPGLMPGTSQLNVSLNGTLFASIPVGSQSSSETQTPGLTPEQEAGDKGPSVTRSGEQSALLQANLTLPAELLVRNNELTFEFIGHYAAPCEDPSNSALWSRVDANSTISIGGSLLALPNDLSLLPLPFYDTASLHPVVPIVFLGQPSAKAMQAAGIIASWLGILSNYRPVRFPVSFETIPPGNAIVLAEGSSGTMPWLAATSGAGVVMRANPVDPNSKVLVVFGGSGDELLRAARALPLHGDTWQGAQVSIPSLTLPAQRNPDDAPRWLRTERGRPSNLGEIAETGALEGDGSVPIAVHLRLPPDLDFGDRTQNLAFHLGYRYNATPLGNESTLQTYVNSAYVSSTPMPHTERASEVLETVVPVPVVDLRPFSNSILMQFAFQIAKKGYCADAGPMDLRGAILKDSYLDIAGIPHMAVLPNLEIFANAGYPFTRRADLADTVVVLPDLPTPEEIEMYLTLMGHFGAQTGYPVLNVGVTGSAGMSGNAGKDYLVLGVAADQPALATLEGALPVAVDGAGLHIRGTGGFFARAAHAWWRVRGSDPAGSGQLETAGGLPDALIEGVEWPRGSRRSVVLIALRDSSVAPGFLATFLRTAQSSDIAQSVSVLDGGRFTSYRIGGDVYRVGEISFLRRVALLFQDLPWLIVLFAVFFCLLLSAVARPMLRRYARAWLEGNGPCD